MSNTNEMPNHNRYSKIEDKTLKFLESLEQNKAPPLYTLSPDEARNILSNLQTTYPVQKLPVNIEDKIIRDNSDKEVSVTIVRPSRYKKEDILPVIMYFHGGGWVLGGFDTHERLIRELANGSNAAIVFVNYTRSPEAKYPQSIEEAYTATKWIAQNGKALKLDTSHLVVAGDSVGGNMATVVALMAKERAGPHIEFQLLFYPVTDYNFNTDSYNLYQEGYFLTREAMKWFWKNYLVDETHTKDPKVSPLQTPIDKLQGLPPTLLIVGENDVLRDEGEAYAHKLMQSGVKVTSIRYLGTIHDFVMLNPITETPAARGAIEQACSTLKKLFGEKQLKK